MQQIQEALDEVISRTFDVKVQAELTRPDPQFGDLTTNVALQLAGRLQRKPREVADELAAQLRETLGEQVSELTVAGPGFINIILSDAVLIAQLQDAQTPRVNAYQGQTILVEYSDPNPFKPLHAGHLYTTLVGDTIARLVERAGAKTLRLNYGGDVGLHVAKSMWAILKYLGGEHPDKLAEVLEAERPAWMGLRYVEGNNAYEDDQAAKAEIISVNKRVYSLHADSEHDSPFAQIYWTCRQWSYDYFTVLYQQLQVAPFDRFIPESEVTQLGITTVQEQLAKGVFKQSDKAVVFDGDQHGLHTRVFINSEGLPTYETKDVGLSLTKWRDYHFDQSIIITANEQEQYMQVVLAAIAQFEPQAAKRTKHLIHGMVKLKGGAKMSSRKGNIVTALEILAAAREAGQQTGTNPSEETVLAAVKYAFAKNRIGSDIAYDPQESIAVEGNSGPYLQYAHARARSILAKASAADSNMAGGEGFELENSSLKTGSNDLSKKVGQKRLEPLTLTSLDDAERPLARKLTQYPEVLAHSVTDLMPHHICTYLYELAQTFNRFYEQAKVIGDPRQATRLQLVNHYANTLQDGLTLLGITAPNKM